MEVLSTKEAREMVQAQPDLSTKIPQFKKVENHSRFLAEYAVIDNDVVLHFFMVPTLVDGKSHWRSSAYWGGQFPTELDKVAQKHFNATYPKLQAQYIPEMTSWWLRAYGFGSVLDVDGLVLGFLKSLDDSLSTTIRT
jgi:hypothetical protein